LVATFTKTSSAATVTVPVGTLTFTAYLSKGSVALATGYLGAKVAVPKQLGYASSTADIFVIDCDTTTSNRISFAGSSTA
jgi:uncharacterized protein involved in propanediol utilization